MAVRYVEKRVLMDRRAIDRALRRIAGEIADRNGGLDGVCLVGIRTRGVDMARRLQRLLAEGEGVEAPLGELDITLYRDDALTGLNLPEVRPTRMPCDVEGRTVVLVDDVLFTGRTVRAAIDAIMDFGRPKSIQLAVLVDRGHRELPIRADFVGRAVETRRDHSVRVQLDERDADERVVVREPEALPPTDVPGGSDAG